MTARAKRWAQLLGWAGILSLIGAAAQYNYQRTVIVKLDGATMGTTWHLTMVGRNGRVGSHDLKVSLEADLERIENIFSNWRPDSAVEKFNRAYSTEWQVIPLELGAIVSYASKFSKETQGAFDITAAPLIDLWGFGAAGSHRKVPSASEIADVKQRVDWKKLEIKYDPPSLRKQDPSLQINVSALVEGYTIDSLAGKLRARSINNYLLEIGGEILAMGTGPSKKPWTLGIQKPGWEKDQLAGTVSLKNEALATAGVYHQYFEADGQRYPHILDARTGRPITHSLQSVSVRAATCLEADSWATALLILGPVEGRALATRLGINAFFLENAVPVTNPTLGNER